MTLLQQLQTLLTHSPQTWESESNEPISAVSVTLEPPGHAEALLRVQADRGSAELANLLTSQPGRLICVKGNVPDAEGRIELLILVDCGGGVWSGIKTHVIET